MADQSSPTFASTAGNSRYGPPGTRYSWSGGMTMQEPTAQTVGQDYMSELIQTIKIEVSELYNKWLQSDGLQRAKAKCPKSQLPRKNLKNAQPLENTIVARTSGAGPLMVLASDDPRAEWAEHGINRVRIRIAGGWTGKSNEVLLQWYDEGWNTHAAIVTADEGAKATPFLTPATWEMCEVIGPIIQDKVNEIAARLQAKYGGM